VSTDVSEEHIASIFRVEKINWARNQRENNVGWHSTDYTVLYSQKMVLFITTAVRT
jgi:hypothetical protein